MAAQRKWNPNPQNLPTQIGCIIVFKEGADPNEIIRRLKMLEGIVDETNQLSPAEYVRYNPETTKGKTPKHLVTTRDGKRTITTLHKFIPEQGNPVFYIP
jgi:hypothetical protein